MSGSKTAFTRGENPLRADKLNQAFSERVLRSGDTMTGILTLWADPQATFDAATKQYVDRLVIGSGGPFLPIAGGSLTGPLAGPSLALNGSGNVFSTTGGLNINTNFAGSGFPAFYNTSRMVFARQTPAVGDFADFQFQRTTTFTAGTQATLNAIARFIGVYGAGDGTNNWNIVSQAQTHGTAGGLALGIFSTAQRLAGATDPIFGGIMNANDITGLASSTAGGQVVGLEVDCQAQFADDRANLAMYGGQGVRIGIDIVAVRNAPANTSPPTEVSHGIWFSSAVPTGGQDAFTNFRSAIGFAVNTQAYQALDTRGAIVPTGFATPFAAVRMLHDQIIDFNGGAALNSGAGNYLQYTTSGTARLRYMVGAVERLSFPDAKPAITGSRAGNAALASLLTALATANLITDSTTA